VSAVPVGVHSEVQGHLDHHRRLHELSLFSRTSVTIGFSSSLVFNRIFLPDYAGFSEFSISHIVLKLLDPGP